MKRSMRFGLCIAGVRGGRLHLLYVDLLDDVIPLVELRSQLVQVSGFEHPEEHFG